MLEAIIAPSSAIGVRISGFDPDDDTPPPISSYELMRAGNTRSLPGGLLKSGHPGRILRVY